MTQREYQAVVQPESVPRRSKPSGGNRQLARRDQLFAPGLRNKIWRLAGFRRAVTTACRQRLSGNAPHAPVLRRGSVTEMTSISRTLPTTPDIGSTVASGHIRSDRRPRIPGDCSTWKETSGMDSGLVWSIPRRLSYRSARSGFEHTRCQGHPRRGVGRWRGRLPLGTPSDQGSPSVHH